MASPFHLVLAVLYASVAYASSSFLLEPGYSFDDFVQDFGRSFRHGTVEYERRKKVFDVELKKILAHNMDPSSTWKRGINQFSDMTREEFASTRTGYNQKLARHMSAARAAELVEPYRRRNSLSELPASMDWREHGVVSDVKDQGQCGSCWAFASTATIESHVALASGTLLTLSTQQLVSCAPNPLQCGGTGGCFGSVPEVAFQYAQLYGMTTEWMFPYTSYFGGDAPVCNMNMSKVPAVAEITGYQKLPVNDYEAVMDALVNIGPLAVNVQADVWKDYVGGVYDGCNNMSNVALDHVVSLVGYGTDPKLGHYWLVRNSWDATWGEQGYIRLRRSATPECGTDVQPKDGTGCEGGPSTQQVCGQCGILFDVSYPVGAKLVQHGNHQPIIQV